MLWSLCYRADRLPPECDADGLLKRASRELGLFSSRSYADLGLTFTARIEPRQVRRDMEILEAIILGVIQGVGEFLPISSSGHLVIGGELLENLLGTSSDPSEKLLLNITLHAGTLGSILVVYRQQVWNLRLQPRVGLLLVAASVPAAVLGLTFRDVFAKVFSTPMVVGVALYATAGLLVVGQRLERGEISYERLPLGKALLIGLFQAGALIPGISRSGSTISGGLLLGLNRESAATFSFLMAIPVIGGAALVEFKDILTGEATVGSPLALLVGGGVSFGVGVVVLRWLVELIAKGRLHWFAWYCTAVGTATIIWQLVASVTAGD